MLKYLLPIGLLILFSIDTLDAQRRGRRRQNRRGENSIGLQYMKSICCYYVSDALLTKETKELIRKDAFALARIVEEKATDQLIEHDYQVEELAGLIYSTLVFLRTDKEKTLTELNHLAIRKGGDYGNYQTDITLEIPALEKDWLLTYTLSFQEGKEWHTKHWKIIVTYCAYEYTVLPSVVVTIPKEIKEVALEKALKELRTLED